MSGTPSLALGARVIDRDADRDAGGEQGGTSA